MNKNLLTKVLLYFKPTTIKWLIALCHNRLLVKPYNQNLKKLNKMLKYVIICFIMELWFGENILNICNLNQTGGCKYGEEICN
ncbi:hypothetical protein COE98_20050 [Bacillus wiedmannii]|nr:hypothetical protein CN672_19100 [Bacillus wiedmannii]PEL56117.1 hypothetical protein CN622_25270 [Bacillus wiedmannii]PEM98611.1 hypothetical protein CN621_24020 [Bacillus wiedmannii]PGB72845.1 hypothetical protein COM03_28775 [Bacillus wiedmannii]PHB88278.1 hypothetical protein COE98_20050 [Bacillus wiedmannii]